MHVQPLLSDPVGDPSRRTGLDAGAQDLGIEAIGALTVTDADYEMVDLKFRAHRGRP
jgi:hypothetical protein